MLYPQRNQFRQLISLPEFWDLCFDPDGQGEGAGWSKGFTDGRPVAVPASWNDQFEDWSDYLGPAWYQTCFGLPWGWDEQRVYLRFGSVNYMAEAFEFCDVVCLNRYWGWYYQGRQLDIGCERLSAEIDELHAKFPKPLLLTEFGADTVPGHHAQPPEMFSEEYQAEMLTCQIEILNSKPFVAGHHVWNMCDFKTGQAVVHMGGLNLKGVFTRDRRPKLAAHRLRELWRA